MKGPCDDLPLLNGRQSEAITISISEDAYGCGWLVAQLDD